METMEIILSIAGVLLGGTSIYTIIENIKYRKENKDLKKNEVEQADITTQMQKIELGNKYIQDSLSTMELVKQALDNGNENQKTMMNKLDRLADQNEKQDGLLTDIVGYLNGGFQAYQAEHGKKAAATTKKPAKKTTKKESDGTAA